MTLLDGKFSTFILRFSSISETISPAVGNLCQMTGVARNSHREKGSSHREKLNSHKLLVAIVQCLDVWMVNKLLYTTIQSFKKNRHEVIRESISQSRNCG